MMAAKAPSPKHRRKLFDVTKAANNAKQLSDFSSKRLSSNQQASSSNGATLLQGKNVINMLSSQDQTSDVDHSFKDFKPVTIYDSEEQSHALVMGQSIRGSDVMKELPTLSVEKRYK